MRKEIGHSFFMDALIRGELIQEWWTKEARVEDGKGILGWSGYGWTVEFDIPPFLSTRWVD